jgi:hypothetical protein
MKTETLETIARKLVAPTAPVPAPMSPLNAPDSPTWRDCQLRIPRLDR